MRFLAEEAGDLIQPDGGTDRVIIRKAVSHDEDLFAVADGRGDRLRDQAGLRFVFAFDAGGNAAVELILRLVADRRLVAAAALRHVERLPRRVVGVVEISLASDADRQRQIGLLALIGEIAHAVENVELVADHTLQRLFLHNDEHPVGSQFAAQRAVGRRPVVDHLFDHRIDGGAFALLERLQQFVRVVEDGQHHARARIVVGAFGLAQRRFVEEIQQIQRLAFQRDLARINGEKPFAEADLEPASLKELFEAVAPQQLLQTAGDGFAVDLECGLERLVEPEHPAAAVHNTAGDAQRVERFAFFIIQFIRNGVHLIQQPLFDDLAVDALQQEKHDEHARLDAGKRLAQPEGQDGEHQSRQKDEQREIHAFPKFFHQSVSRKIGRIIGLRFVRS